MMPPKITREFCEGDRYLYDWGPCSADKGFAQFDTDQDASYYGNWVNPFALVLFSYAEGDCATTECGSVSEFVGEVRAAVEWHGNHGGFIGIDPGFNAELKARFESIGLADLIH